MDIESPIRTCYTTYRIASKSVEDLVGLYASKGRVERANFFTYFYIIMREVITTTITNNNKNQQ